MDDGPIYIDNTILNTVASCSTEAVLAHVLDYQSREESAPLLSGQAAHAALAIWFQGISKSDALHEFANIYKDWADQNVEPGDRLTFLNCHTVLSYWFDTHPPSSFPFRVMPEHTEIGFSHQLDDEGEFMFFGLLDLFAYDLHDDFCYVVDHKTTGSVNRYWAKQFRLAAQLTGYQWLGQKYLGDEGSVVGSFINAIEFSKLPSDPSRKCPKHSVAYIECGPLHTKTELLGPFMRSPHKIEVWRLNAIELAKRYRSLLMTYPVAQRLHRVKMEGTFNGSCRFCQFYEFCNVDRPLDFIDSHLIQRRWEPWAEDGAMEMERVAVNPDDRSATDGNV